ncbi:putative damage-inducible protein DinB [Scopulibacillus darangshiensis]|uniref:Putative damage-inducible protein DinB n=1 Tax=Scopulibacillus darangshiensis TaxID=442528 RepID=A0A4R2P5M0_9BACL|nr:DinB family protein [Scopulibacillus darangshiensis]TCP29987.1 putative damage-inducible protein DinB [Scopulibacillus darangshiensis]
MRHSALKSYDYHVWANKRVLDHLKSLPEEVYCQEIQSVFSSISEVVKHVYRVDIVWLGVMAGDSFEEINAMNGRILKGIDGKGLVEMEKLYDETVEKYMAFLDRQEDLDKDVSPEHPELGRLDTTLSELIQHVVNHGTYHRGNITAMLRQLGHKGVPTDYVFYLYEQSSVR